MSWSFRKGINLGGGVRVNLSKSGIGYSIGGRGFRVGTSTRGKNFVSIGTKGIFYKKYFSESNENHVNGHHSQQIIVNNATLGDIRIHNSVDAEKIKDINSSMLLDELNSMASKMKMIKYICIASIVIGIFFQPLLVLTVILGLFYLYNITCNRTEILYDIESSVSIYFTKLENAFKELRLSHKIWSIESQQKVIDRKYHAGANNLLDMHDSFVATGCHSFIKTNVRIYKIKAGKEMLYFFPDRILIFCNNKFGAVNYRDLIIESNKSNLIIENKPRDALVVDYTWKYVNKKGGPDKRFKDNKQLFIIECDTLKLTSQTGLLELLKFSKNGCTKSFNNVLMEIKALNFLKEVSSKTNKIVIEQ